MVKMNKSEQKNKAIEAIKNDSKYKSCPNCGCKNKGDYCLHCFYKFEKTEKIKEELRDEITKEILADIHKALEGLFIAVYFPENSCLSVSHAISHLKQALKFHEE